MEGTNPVKDMVSGEKLSSLEDIINRWTPRTWYQEVWWWIRYGTWNWIGYRGEVWRYVVRFWQRGLKGYATCDVWGLNYYLAAVILGSVTELRNNLNGHPCDLKDLNEWKSILEQIIWTFEVVINIYDHDWMYLEPERRNAVEMKKLYKFAAECEKSHKKRGLDKTKYHVMTYEECERYEKGWEQFQRYFFSLWD